MVDFQITFDRWIITEMVIDLMRLVYGSLPLRINESRVCSVWILSESVDGC